MKCSKSKSRPSLPDKILIRGVNWIGDAVMTLPSIKAVRKSFSDASISLLVKPSVSAVFQNSPDIDEIILYEDRHNGLFGRLKLANELRKKSFTKALLLQNAFDAALISFLAGIPERMGYNRDIRGFLLTKPVRFNGDDRRMHHVDYYLNLITKLRTADSNPRNFFSFPYIYLTLEERLSAREKLSHIRRPILAMNPGATFGSAKRWVPERFAEVTEWFIKDTGGSVLIFGSRSEVEIADEIIKHSSKLRVTSNESTGDMTCKQTSSLLTRHSLLNLAGKTELRELIALISECDVLVSNDSGPMHIAYAVGTPLIAIFGSTSPELTGPLGNNSIAIKHKLSCSPCFERACKNKDNYMGCMYAVSSEDVFFSVKEIMPIKKAVFFDRDGTLCRDAGYLNNWDDFKVFNDIGSLKRLKEKGFLLIGATNQSGIDRGIVDEAFANEVNQVLMDRYGFDDFYYCPHHPDEHCPCRKPEPLMLLNARAKHKINLKESYMVGDKDSDMLLAKAVGAKGILVRTGERQESAYADFIANNLADAVDFIIKDCGV